MATKKSKSKNNLPPLNRRKKEKPTESDFKGFEIVCKVVNYAHKVNELRPIQSTAIIHWIMLYTSDIVPHERYFQETTKRLMPDCRRIQAHCDDENLMDFLRHVYEGGIGASFDGFDSDSQMKKTTEFMIGIMAETVIEDEYGFLSALATCIEFMEDNFTGEITYQ